MLAFILRRFAQSIVVMLVVALISFTLFRFVGDPVASIVGQEASVADREALRERL
ncbi:MAG: ABC transporter permease, partial [bacterium]|nr:ABC transporter permease [bacterium]